MWRSFLSNSNIHSYTNFNTQSMGQYKSTTCNGSYTEILLQHQRQLTQMPTCRHDMGFHADSCTYGAAHENARILITSTLGSKSLLPWMIFEPRTFSHLHWVCCTTSTSLLEKNINGFFVAYPGHDNMSSISPIRVTMTETRYIISISYKASVGGVTVSIVAFQAVDPGSTPGQRRLFFFLTTPAVFSMQVNFLTIVTYRLN